MKNVSLIGRILFALPFAVLGLNHYFMVDYYTGMLSSFIPGGVYTVFLTGFIMIAAAVFIIIKRFVKEATLALAVLLCLYILTIHIPHLFDAQIELQQVLMPMFKDISLLGGSLLILSMCDGNKKTKNT
jgi:uncharacterized membrane protein YphA (DoxX/SURF4 family)